MSARKIARKFSFNDLIVASIAATMTSIASTKYILTRRGTFGEKTIQARNHDSVVYFDLHQRNWVFFEYFSYKVITDINQETPDTNPGCTTKKFWGVSLKPIKFII
jgi:hypothetical protein